MKHTANYRWLVFFLALLSCSRLADLSGTSGTGNSFVSGKIVTATGDVIPNTQVQLFPVAYNPVVGGRPVLTDTTDESGTYTFANVDTGAYNLQVVQLLKRTRALIRDMHVADDTVAVPDKQLQRPGSIKVMFYKDAIAQNGYVYVPGTSIFSYLNNDNDYVFLDSVPAGVLPAVSYSSKSSSFSTAIRYDVPVIPGDTAFVHNPSWKYARHLILNTTTGGANVTGDVMNFPVVVRLNKGSFVFSQAKADGADIRFSKADNTFLPFEIERWDGAAGSAEIWVKVDTVRGNNNSQNIIMYWGNPDAAPLSNGAAVFDTANGFAGVWHLGESSDSIYDATGDAFNGQKYGSTMAPGMVGKSQSFASGNYILIPGLLNRPSNVTLSAWVRYDTSTGGQDIVSIGDAVFVRADDIINGIGTTGSYHNNSVVNDSNYAYVSSGQFLVKSGWHYLAFSINNATHVQTLFIDGAQWTISHDVNPIYYAGLGADTYIGIHGNGKTIFNFIGQIDEVRVNSISVDSDWVKLCFMNQKTKDALIVW